MAEIEFVSGMIVKPPRPGAPDFVKATISIKREELAAWLAGRTDEWINLDVKEAKSGKWYAAVNTYKKPDDQAPKESKPAHADSGSFDDFESDNPF